MSKRQTGEHVAIDGDKRRRRRKGGLRVPSDNVPRPGDGEIATPQPADPRLAVSVAYTFTSDGSRHDNGRVRAREPGFEDEDLNTNPEAPVVTDDASDLDVPVDDDDSEELSDDDLDAEDELEADGEEELDDDDLEDDDEDIDDVDSDSPFERDESEYSVPVDEMSDEDMAAMGVDPVDITETESAEFDSPDPAEGARAAGKPRRSGDNGRTEETAAASGDVDDSTVIEESEERYPVSVGAALPVAEPADDSDLARTIISRPRAGSQPDARSLAPVATLDIDPFDDEEDESSSSRPPTGDETTGDSVDIAFDEEEEGRFQVGAAEPVTISNTPPELEAVLERVRAEEQEREAAAAEQTPRDVEESPPVQRVPPSARFQRAATMELSLVDLEEIAESAESERERDNSQITEAPQRREPASPPTPGVPSVVASLEEKLDAAARVTTPMPIEPADPSDSGELLTDDLLEELDDGAAVKARSEPEQEVELTGEEEEVLELPGLDTSDVLPASSAPAAAAAAPATAEPHPPPPPRVSKAAPPPAPQRSGSGQAGNPAVGQSVVGQAGVSVATSAAVAAAAVTSVSASASPASAASTSRARKRGRPWFDEVFDEDYLRTLPFLTPGATQAEAQFVMESLGVEPGGQILDIGCGYGRHAMELAARGYHVVGLDSSLPLLLRGADEAQRRGLTINFIHGDMRDLNFDSQFDGAYCLFSTFGYFDDETNKKTAQHIARALRPGARCVFEVLNRDYLIADLPSRVWWEGDGCVVLEEVQFNYFSSRIISNRSIVFDDGRQIEQEISLRCFSLHELGKLLHAAGFRVLEISGSMTTRGRFFGAQSRDIVVVAERRAKKDDRPDNGS